MFMAQSNHSVWYQMTTEKAKASLLFSYCEGGKKIVQFLV